MKIKATWDPIIRNPFNPNIHMIPVPQFKVVEVDDNTNMDDLKKFAEEDTPRGYTFREIIIVPDETPVSPKNE